MKDIVISGINLFQGGTLSIFYDCLDAIKQKGLWKTNRITVFVHRKELFEKYKDIVCIIELPKSRLNYLYRLYYEYMYFYRFSLKNDIDIWFSIHDLTPRVKAKRLYTYCHSPSPFLKKEIKMVRYGWKIILAAFFYKIFYRINITKADAIIVQQDWMRKEFLRMFPIQNVIVARPTRSEKEVLNDFSINNSVPVFIFPSLPRPFKNFEVILKACKVLQDEISELFEVWLTIDGTENTYSMYLKKKYGALRNIKWLGLLPRNELIKKYEAADYMIFPSKMETWGLPISEFKWTTKPMLVSDLPYAHETVGDYEKVCFFKPDDYVELADLMRKFIKRSIDYDGNTSKSVDPPYANDWDELFGKMGFEG